MKDEVMWLINQEDSSSILKHGEILSLHIKICAAFFSTQTVCMNSTFWRCSERNVHMCQLTYWVPTRRIYSSYYSCRPCACRTGKPIPVFSQIFQQLIYEAHDCRPCILQLFNCSQKNCTLNEKPGHQSVFLIYAHFSWKLPGTGPAAGVKFPGHWKG